MSVNRIALGKRISFYRLKFSMTQEKLADLTNCSREYIAYLENGVKTPSLPILVDLANALHISVDALLVDSLDYSLSSSDSDLHRLLLDCNETEQEIIIRTARELKATLVSFGIYHPSVLKSQNKKSPHKLQTHPRILLGAVCGLCEPSFVVAETRYPP